MIIFLLALCPKDYGCTCFTKRILLDGNLKNPIRLFFCFGLRTTSADTEGAHDSLWLLTSSAATPSEELEWLRCHRAEREREAALQMHSPLPSSNITAWAAESGGKSEEAGR